MNAFLLAFGVVFVAELGDKSQLMAMSFAARYRPITVFAAITAGAAATHLLSVVVGSALGAALPRDAIAVAGGIAFLAFALWTLRDALSEDDDDLEAVATARRGDRSVFLTVAGAFFLAELGDKTMLASITLAADNGAVGTWLGATLAMVAVDGIAIVVGRQLAARLPRRTVGIGSAAVFALVGVVLLVDATR